MSVTARAAGALAALALVTATGPVFAQEPGADRFFFVEESDEEERESTAYDGSLTSTTFYYREDGSQAAPLTPGGTGPLIASPVDRLFTDLRAQLNAKHIAGSKVEFRFDGRGRLSETSSETASNPADMFELPEVSGQSGLFGDNELELREMYFRRDGSEYDLTVGRQFVLELAATKIDGLQIQRQAGKEWRYLAFAGLYPSRISRDVREDYPVIDNNPEIDVYERKRVMPVSGGLGAAYRFERAYGAFGGVSIFPLANDYQTGTLEKPRVFGTANGYWRQSATVDIYHYLVLDATSSAGAGLRNLTIGLNWQPAAVMRAYGQVSRVDTETLNVIAQTKLEDPDGARPATSVQNNIEVERIAQDQARVGLSVALRQRFEISTSGTLRRRGELVLNDEGDMNDPADDVVFPAAQGADITFSAVDRRSIRDIRLGLSATRSFSVGSANLYRTKSWVARLDGSKEVAEGKGEVEGSFTYVQSKDDNRGAACNPADPVTCYGAAQVQSFTVGGLAHYRFKPDWFLIASAAIGRQLMSAADVTGTLQAQPALTTLNLLFRIAYRF
jgi:hypothetical protein